MNPLRFIGMLLIVVCLVGFAVVADDFRHVGELIGVGAIGVAGILLTMVGRLGRSKQA